MNNAIYTTTSGGIAALERLEAAAQNLANLGTNGYKAERPVFSVLPPPSGSESSAPVVEVSLMRDFSQGPIRSSGNPLDVAILGDGFFVVDTARGERYTRQGTFSLDAEGFLATASGERVQGDGGSIRPGEGPITIAGDGSVVVDGATRGRLRVVSFGDEPALVPEGDSLFAPAPDVVPVPLDPTAVRLESGAIEASNVDPATMMIELIDVARAFESYMQALQRIDEVAQQSITEVGSV